MSFALAVADCVSSRIARDWQQEPEDNMDEEDLAPQRKKAPPRDLTPLAIAELEAYISDLEAEIARARAEIGRKRAQRSGAESLFKR